MASLRAQQQDLARMRMASLGVVRRSADPAAVVRRLLAMQGQDFGAVQYAIAARSDGGADAGAATRAEVRAAFDSGTIVRSWPMRGTLHAVAAEDIGWLQGLTTQRSLVGVEKRWQLLGLDREILERMRELSHELLAGRRALTRDELMRGFAEAGIEPLSGWGYHCVWYLAQTGTLTFGPLKGDEHALVLTDEWITAPRQLDGDEALGEFVGRYLSSHGPATLKDFSWWSKLPLRDAKIGLAAALANSEHSGISLTSTVVEGVEYWYDEAVVEATGPAKAPAVLLPAFDEHLLGYQDRSLVLPAEHAQAIVPGNNGMFLPTIVDDGRVVGLWKRTARAAGPQIALLPFAPLNARQQREAQRSAHAYGAYLGQSVTFA